MAPVHGRNLVRAFRAGTVDLWPHPHLVSDWCRSARPVLNDRNTVDLSPFWARGDASPQGRVGEPDLFFDITR